MDMTDVSVDLSQICTSSQGVSERSALWYQASSPGLDTCGMCCNDRILQSWLLRGLGQKARDVQKMTGLTPGQEKMAMA